MVDQLILPLPDIDRRDESPRFRKCYQAKKRWERFMAHWFDLSLSDEAYKQLFPKHALFDIERAGYAALDAWAVYFDEMREMLRKQIAMCGGIYYRFQDISEDERYYALCHWVEWCDLLEGVGGCPGADYHDDYHDEQWYEMMAHAGMNEDDCF